MIHASLFSQAAVIRQDSILELCVREGGASLGRPVRSLSRDGTGEVGTAGELALLQRQHSLLQEELVRLRGSEGKLKDSEKARALLEKQLRDLRSNGAALVDSAGRSQVLQWIKLFLSCNRSRNKRMNKDFQELVTSCSLLYIWNLNYVNYIITGV